MTFDHAVVLADAGLLEARTLRDEPLDVVLDVNAFLLEDFLVSVRKLQKLVIERRCEAAKANQSARTYGNCVPVAAVRTDLKSLSGCRL